LKSLCLTDEVGLPGLSQVEQPYAILNTGARIPLVGLGTFKANATTTNEAVAAALEAGYRRVCNQEAVEAQTGPRKQANSRYCRPLSSKCYCRHIDCASHYGNEPAIGNGLHAAFKKGIANRSDVFITSKLW
jgi:diketogulonate reductase-like aldo/keto reductase